MPFKENPLVYIGIGLAAFAVIWSFVRAYLQKTMIERHKKSLNKKINRKQL